MAGNPGGKKNKPPVAFDVSAPSFDEDTPATVDLDYTDPEGDLATSCSTSGLFNVSISEACSTMSSSA